MYLFYPLAECKQSQSRASADLRIKYPATQTCYRYFLTRRNLTAASWDLANEKFGYKMWSHLLSNRILAGCRLSVHKHITKSFRTEILARNGFVSIYFPPVKDEISVQLSHQSFFAKSGMLLLMVTPSRMLLKCFRQLHRGFKNGVDPFGGVLYLLNVTHTMALTYQ